VQHQSVPLREFLQLGFHSAPLGRVGFHHEYIDPADVQQLSGRLAFHVQHQAADQVLVGQAGDPDPPRTGVGGHLDVVADLEPAALGQHRPGYRFAGEHPLRHVVRIAHREVDRHALAVREPLDQDHHGLLGHLGIDEPQTAQPPDAGNGADFRTQFLRHVGRPAFTRIGHHRPHEEVARVGLPQPGSNVVDVVGDRGA